MLLVIILIVIIVASLAGLFYLLFKHLPDLRNININSLKEEKQASAKAKILQAKFFRNSSKAAIRIRSVFSGRGQRAAEQFKKLKAWVSNLEHKYQAKESSEPIKIPTTDELIAEAKELVAEEDFSLAEKRLIEVIAKDKKNKEAYELLGKLYFYRKDYNQAEEIYQYLLKLSLANKKFNQAVAVKGERLEELETDFLSSLDIEPQLAVYYDDLGQIYEIMDKADKALDCYLKAASIVPNNPKYLDKLIELSIKLGEKSLAKKTFNRLSEINSENGKLDDFREAIEKM
ncbi:MAG: hypothetical protein WC518_02690 [Patescibacteria group bacterium]